jgi:hypothetical protein
MDDDDGFSTTPAPPAPRQNPLLTLARDHLGLSIPIAGALIFAFRCVIVSDGDVTVAFMLVTETSIGDAIRALLFTVIPILLTLLSVVAILIAGMRVSYGGRRNYFEILGLVIVGVASLLGNVALRGGGEDPGELVLLAALILLSMPFISGMLVGSIERSRKAARNGREALSLERREGAHTGVHQDDQVSLAVGTRSVVMHRWFAWGTVFVLMGIIVFLALRGFGEQFAAKTFWLPRERLDFKNEAPFTGYVLKVSQDHLIILNDNPRVIVEKHKDTLEDRDFCYPEDHEARSSNVQSDAPACP